MKDTFTEKYHYYSIISKEYFPTSVCSYQKDLILARNFTIVSTDPMMHWTTAICSLGVADD